MNKDLKFKVGDKVKYVEAHINDYDYEAKYLNQIGEIIKIIKENCFSHIVKFDSDYEGSFHPSSLELFEEESSLSDCDTSISQNYKDSLSVFNLLEILVKQLNIKNTLWEFSSDSELDEKLKSLSLQVVDNLVTRIEKHQDYDRIIENILDKLLEEYD